MILIAKVKDVNPNMKSNPEQISTNLTQILKKKYKHVYHGPMLDNK